MLVRLLLPGSFNGFQQVPAFTVQVNDLFGPCPAA